MPRGFPTVIHALLARGHETAGRPYLVFDDGRGAPVAWTYGETLAQAGRAAAALTARGVTRNDRVVIVGGNEPATVATLFGAMGAGALPAIVHSPLRADSKAAVAHLGAVIGRAEPKVVVAPTKMVAAVAAGPLAISAADLLADPGEPMALVPPAPEAPSYLQFSSGSTGAQKAVIISAGAQAHNALATGRDVGLSEDETWVSWLPG